MVGPLAPALIGLAGALGSAGLAAGASSRASSANAAMNQANINATERENFLQRIMAERLLQLQLETTTDAFGNTAEYIPGVGFVTTPAPAVKTLQDAALREQTQQLTTDAGRQREGRGRAAQRGRREGATADSLLDEFLRRQENPQDANELFQMLLTQGNQGFQGEMDRQQQNALRQDLRSGGGSGGKLLAEFARASAAGRGDRAASAKLQSITGAEDINQQQRGNSANLFNLFAQRAQNSFGNVPFAPDAVSPQATALGTGQRSSALGASQLAAWLSRGTAPQGQPQPPDLGAAKFVGEAGTALSSLFRTLLEKKEETPSGTGRRLGNQFNFAP